MCRSDQLEWLDHLQRIMFWWKLMMSKLKRHIFFPTWYKKHEETCLFMPSKIECYSHVYLLSLFAQNLWWSHFYFTAYLKSTVERYGSCCKLFTRLNIRMMKRRRSRNQIAFLKKDRDINCGSEKCALIPLRKTMFGCNRKYANIVWYIFFSK